MSNEGGQQPRLPEDVKAWDCPRGHTYFSVVPIAFGMTRLTEDGGVEEDIYCYCPICMMEWYRTHIPEVKERKRHGGLRRG